MQFRDGEASWMQQQLRSRDEEEVKEEENSVPLELD